MKALKIETVLDTETGCWNCISHRPASNGYRQVRINNKRSYIHRLVYENYKGKIPEGLQILHSCDNPRCCNPEHMSVGTAADNIADKVAKNRQAKGVQCPTHKLTEKQVLKIRGIGARKTLSELAEKYHVHATTISRILKRTIWCHI